MTFLALLELLRRRLATARQSEPMGPIVIYRTVERADETAESGGCGCRRGAAGGGRRRRGDAGVSARAPRSRPGGGDTGERWNRIDWPFWRRCCSSRRSPFRWRSCRRSWRTPDPAETDASLRDLALRLESEGRGLMVQEVAGGFRLTTRPDVHAWIQKLQQVKPTRLSRAALETLAIIAYRQPITRAEIEAIRGVAVDGVLRTLLERELVRMMGRKAEAGRPMLYGTSQQFLEHFGLRELGDLPTLREINELIGITETGAEIDAPAESTQPITVGTPIAGERESVEGPQRVVAGPAAAAEPCPVDGERTRPDLDAPTVVAGPAAAATGAAFPTDDPSATPELGADRASARTPRRTDGPGPPQATRVTPRPERRQDRPPLQRSSARRPPGRSAPPPSGRPLSPAARSRSRGTPPKVPGPGRGGVPSAVRGIDHRRTRAGERGGGPHPGDAGAPGAGSRPGGRGAVSRGGARHHHVAQAGRIHHGGLRSGGAAGGARRCLPRAGLPRLFPVGRLDWDTEGLLLLTNDGDLANLLTHPRHGVSKVYHAKVKGRPTSEALRRLLQGVMSEGERLSATAARVLRTTQENTWVMIGVHQGRYRQVRRMCEAIGHPVLKLVRVALGPLSLGSAAARAVAPPAPRGGPGAGGVEGRESARKALNTLRCLAIMTP